MNLSDFSKSACLRLALGIVCFVLLGHSAVKADPVFPNLGVASQFGVLYIGPNTGNSVSITGPSSVKGNIGLLNGNLSVTGPSTVTGNVVLNGGQVNSGQSSITGSITQNGSLLNQAARDAIAASNYAAGLAATNTSITDINNFNGTITGGAQVNVLNLTNLVLNNGNLVLSAPTGGSFIINVTGKFALNGGSKILLAGGLNSSNVIFNVIGTGEQVAFTGGAQNGVPNSQITGTLLATQRDIALSPGLVNGLIVGGGHQITITSGGQVIAPPPPSGVPEPATLVLMGTGFAGLAARARKRKRLKRNTGETG